MLSHVTIAVRDVETALAFWRPLMARLGNVEAFTAPGDRAAAFRHPDHFRPLFFVSRPFEGDAAPGNGPMVAFMAPDRAAVREVHAMALEAGAIDEGAPGPRPQYHPNYYGGYFRDPDGNKCCVVSHRPEE